jgi:hypothetical protein
VDAVGVGRPHRKVDAEDAGRRGVAARDVGAEPLVGARVCSFCKEMDVDVAEAGHSGHRI